MEVARRRPDTVVAYVHGGPSEASGVGSEPLAIGFRVAAHLGLQIGLSERLSFAPEIGFAYARWGFHGDAHFIGYPIGGRISAVNALVGVRFAFFVDPVEFWAAGHLGVGWVDRTVEPPPGLSASDTDLAWNLEAGACWMVLRYLGAGVFVAATKTAVGVLGNTSFSSVGLGFGLSLKLVLPLKF